MSAWRCRAALVVAGDHDKPLGGLFFCPDCSGPQRALLQLADNAGLESHGRGLSAVWPSDLTVFVPFISGEAYYSVSKNTWRFIPRPVALRWSGLKGEPILESPFLEEAGS